jgi:hypothetical protein
VEREPDRLQLLLDPLRQGRRQLRQHQRRERCDVSADDSGRGQHAPVQGAGGERGRQDLLLVDADRGRQGGARCAANPPLQVAGLSLPERLDIDQGTITPGIVGRSTQQVTVRFRVSCKGKAVQGALVYAAAVPFNQFTIPAEQPTGADGYAQLTMTQLSGFPAARQQQLLVVFARARKPGENALGGISTRRLVSFPVDLRR